MGQSTFHSPQKSNTPLTPHKRGWSQTFASPSARSPLHFQDRKEDSEESEYEVTVSTFDKCYNFLGALVAGAIYFYLLLYTAHLWTIDTAFSIILAEYCGWSNERTRKMTVGQDQSRRLKSDDLSYAEKGDYFISTSGMPHLKLDCIAAIVGYREDPAIFTKAMESYLEATGCRFVLACIDGNDLEDQEMVHIFQKVFPSNCAVLNLPIPFVEIALQMNRDKPKWMPDTELITKCVVMAKQALLENNVHVIGPDAITRLCVTQPHMHKKGVMFTSFVISLALSELLQVDFLWTSDSDSIVYKDTLRTTIETIAGDEKCAGASTALAIHNRNETLVTKLGNTVFLNELHLSRCFSSAVGANDCQSGPCAIFRIKALRSELLEWYQQTVWGHWMIINEDRHLTTRLLLRGHRVRFISNAVTATETPVSLRRWLLQQVRWARSVHIETFALPSVYLAQPPLFFFAALRRQITSFLLFTIVMSYLCLGKNPFLPFNISDFLYRLLFTVVYLKIRNPIHPTWEEWSWSIPSSLFYNVPLPAVQVWSMITVFADGWGTSMRGSKEMEEKTRWRELKKKAWEVGFFVFWMGVVGGVLGRWFGTMAALDGREVLLCISVGAMTMWGGFGYWMVVAE